MYTFTKQRKKKVILESRKRRKNSRRRPYRYILCVPHLVGPGDEVVEADGVAVGVEGEHHDSDHATNADEEEESRYVHQHRPG